MHLQHNQSLLAACTRAAELIPTYDDAIGDLYLYQDAEFRTGLVRTHNWIKADSIVLDEILSPIPRDDIPEAYGLQIYKETSPDHPTRWTVRKDLNRHPWSAPILSAFPDEESAITAAIDYIAETVPDLAESYEYQDTQGEEASGIVRTCPHGSNLGRVDPATLRDLGIILILETED